MQQKQSPIKLQKNDFIPVGNGPVRLVHFKQKSSKVSYKTYKYIIPAAFFRCCHVKSNMFDTAMIDQEYLRVS